MFPAPTLSRTQLPNGVPVVSEPLSGVHSIVVGAWVRYGSHFETPSNSGISHLLEHLLFKGTKSRSAEQISLEIDDVGGDLDAFTERECTCYYVRVMPEHLKIGLDLLCDVLLRPAFDPEEFEREKQVVLQEIKQAQDNPADAVGDLLSRIMFPGQPFGLPVLGDPEFISAVQADDARAFYAQAYQPKDMFITVSGNLDQNAFFEELQRHFTDGTSSQAEGLGQAVASRSLPSPVYHPGCVTETRDIQQVHLCLGLPGLTQHDDDKYALSLIDAALGGSVSSRLFQEIREKRGLAYSVSSFMFALDQVGTFGVQVATTVEHIDALVEIVQSELASLRKQGLSESELQKAKNQARGSLLMGLETTGSRMMALGRCLLYFDRVISVEETLKNLDEVSQKDTVRVSERLFDGKSEAWALIGPLGTDSDHPHFLERGVQS